MDATPDTADDARRSARIEARTTPDTLDAIRRAARLEGRSVSDFVVSAARERADRAIMDHDVLRLSAEDQRRVADLLLDPPAPNAALREAGRRHRELADG